MKRLLTYFFILFLSIWIGIKIQAGSGYVLIAYNNYTIEATLWVAFIAILLLFLLFYFFIRLTSGVYFFPNRIRIWRQSRIRKKSHMHLVKGFHALAEGDWRRAEKKLVRAAKNEDIAMMNYLGAAYSAHQQQAHDRRDEYLGKAQFNNKNASLAIGLTQAKLHIANRQWESAFAVLQNLRQINPRNIMLLKLLQQVYVELHDWDNLKELLPTLRRRKVLSPENFQKLEQRVYLELMQSALKAEKFSELEIIWKKMPWHLQYEPTVLIIYIDYLLSHNQTEKAETLLKKTLKNNLNPMLLNRFGLLKSENPIKQLKIAEAWYKHNEQNQPLLLCLGRLCKQQKLWGKARFYLEKSLKLSPSIEVYNELGQIMEEQGEKNAALNYYKMAANLFAVATLTTVVQ